jgi:hypothetical protein
MAPWMNFANWAADNDPVKGRENPGPPLPFWPWQDAHCRVKIAAPVFATGFGLVDF